MSDESYTIDHEATEWTHHDPEKWAKATLDADDHSEVENGTRLAVYLKSEDGTRLGYYRFTVNDVEHRLVNWERSDDDIRRPPTTVIKAVHRGGWVMNNVPNTHDFEDRSGEPMPVRLLDMRDAVERYATSDDHPTFTREFLLAVSRALAEAASHAAAAEGASHVEETMDEAVEELATTRYGAVDYDELVEGAMLAAANPERKNSDEHHQKTLEMLEDARGKSRSNNYGQLFADIFKRNDWGYDD